MQRGNTGPMGAVALVIMLGVAGRRDRPGRGRTCRSALFLGVSSAPPAARCPWSAARRTGGPQPGAGGRRWPARCPGSAAFLAWLAVAVVLGLGQAVVGAQLRQRGDRRGGGRPGGPAADLALRTPARRGHRGRDGGLHRGRPDDHAGRGRALSAGSDPRAAAAGRRPSGSLRRWPRPRLVQLPSRSVNTRPERCSDTRPQPDLVGHRDRAPPARPPGVRPGRASWSSNASVQASAGWLQASSRSSAAVSQLPSESISTGCRAAPQRAGAGRSVSTVVQCAGRRAWCAATRLAHSASTAGSACGPGAR